MDNQPPSVLPDPSIIEPVEVLHLDHYCEGPVVDRHGALYISACSGGYVLKRTPGGEFVEWTAVQRPNGHKILPNGEHLLCDTERGAVLRLDADGQVLEEAAAGHAASDSNGPDHELSRPNDLTLDPGGGFYVTDSVRHHGAVIFVSPGGQQRIVAGNIDFANGVVLSADGQQLYVAESYQNRILVIDLEVPGVAVGPPRVHAELPTNQKGEKDAYNLPDGIALDADGRLWVAHYGMSAVHVLGGDGQLLATYDAGHALASNLCFADGLYVTGGDGEPGPGTLVRLDLGS